jgi:hypothetical protein
MYTIIGHFENLAHKADLHFPKLQKFNLLKVAITLTLLTLALVRLESWEVIVVGKSCGY